ERERAETRPRGIEQVYELLLLPRRRHRNLGEIHAGKTAACPTGPRDRARDSETQPVGALVADYLQRQAGGCRTLQSHRAIRIQQTAAQRRQEAAHRRTEAYAGD